MNKTAAIAIQSAAIIHLAFIIVLIDVLFLLYELCGFFIKKRRLVAAVRQNIRVLLINMKAVVLFISAF
ncbi:hypothetical protein CHCC5022_3272 [Bacillus paralicheniformis]|uniref:Uncharacterized protein n=1 Tax=Bacillus paralicheniformis TaxID=1648923 RepID=A0A7Z0WWX9_9BACI|nr:hypothetical protein B4121_3084 [Bacillus paralicheniformis]TWJ65731.1 hypothetical protein CHCC5022_3272 [Bacillus paralicheniformis]TWJ77663.1 hypothetical protein CHCC4186_4479 [Bacillus paralicheniformis]TWK24870.1 hypothetical protein CHCC20372_2398 [Bacillus paralicheniformis]